MLFTKKSLISYATGIILMIVLVGCVQQISPLDVGEINASSSTSILVGETASLSISASGANLEFKWTVEQGTLSDGTSPSSVTYRAPNTSGTDTVTVEVTSSDGQNVVKHIIFTVEDPPTPIPPPSPTATETPLPTATPTGDILVADFNTCNSTNNVFGKMGAAYTNPNNTELVEGYEEEAGRGCMAKLDYDLNEWAAFWLKLESLNLSQISQISFDVKADANVGIPDEFKIEIKGQGQCMVTYASGISDEWQTKTIQFSEFGPGDCGSMLTSFEKIDELVFVFEAKNSGKQGVVYLDNIVFMP